MQGKFPKTKKVVNLKRQTTANYNRSVEYALTAVILKFILLNKYCLLSTLPPN